VVLSGTIANGGSAATNLILGARVGNNVAGTNYIQIDGANTYTGTTTLGVQANVNTVFRINSAQPFGPANGGALTIGNNTYVNTFEAMGTDRAITKNSATINRSVVFQGSNSLTIAATTLNMSNSASTSNSTVGVFAFINNNITAPGKTLTLGTAGGNLYLNGSNTTDLYRMRDVSGAGTTIISSNIGDNSGASVPTDSRMVIQQAGTGSLILTGTNTYQGGTRITGTGAVELGNGGITGSLAPANGSVPIVNSTAAGTLAFNHSDAISTTLTANGPVGLLQKGSGSVTLTNSQFNSGANTVGDGTSASKLVVTGALVPLKSTATNATVGTTAPGTNLTVNTVTLGGTETVANLNLKVGQPVYLSSGGASSVAYIDSITGGNTFRVFGGTLLAAGTVGLTFGEGSALGTSAAITTVKNLSTLAGTGVISGAVNGLAGSHLAPGVNTVDADVSERFNFGVAGTLATGALTLTGANLDFDLAATVAGTSDFISSSGAVSFASLTFSFNALTAGVLETGAAYNLVSGVGGFTGDVNGIGTTFGSGLSGLTPNYSVGGNILSVSFTAIPEPASLGLAFGVAALGGCLVRRRRKTQA
jgi:autotransporter-associated beta strand protein